MDTLTRAQLSKAGQLLSDAARGAEAKGSRDRDYSLIRLLDGLSAHAVQRLAPHEYECSQRIADALGRAPHPGHAFVPVDLDQRDLTVGVGSGGGYTVQTETAPGNLFLHYLHASSVLTRQGVSRLAMQGNASVPSVSGTATAGWLSTEGSTLTESQITFALSAATPKSVGCYVEASRLLLTQAGTFANDFIMRILGRAVAAEVDQKFLSGTGASGQPTGVLNAGIGAVSGSSLAYAGILDTVKTVEDLSAIIDPTKAGFVVAPDAARLLRLREKVAGSGTIMTANDLAGYPAHVTKSIPDASLIFADWSQLLQLEWGQLEIGADPYGANSALFTKGLVGLRAIWSVDCLILQSKSFVKITGTT
jgi:HK97 family phage major capsid protein